ncbi:MAG TPA: GDSL-type esterase/lipase family protein, partial [Actinomycetota bacterium]|nr:GDSL-type esterase/lipase family protein [Actinomycetota bacterium]
GARVSGALADQVPLVEALDPPPDVIVTEIGANDAIRLTGGRRFRRDYDRLLERVDALGARHVVCLGLPSFSSTPRFLQPLRAIIAWRARVLDAEVRASAAEHGAHYVDIAAATEPAFDADPEGTHAADDFHPNDAGYRAWARAVLSVLRPLVTGSSG